MFFIPEKIALVSFILNSGARTNPFKEFDFIKSLNKQTSFSKHAEQGEDGIIMPINNSYSAFWPISLRKSVIRESSTSML